MSAQFLTPAGKMERNGTPLPFGEIGKGERFELNGNIWVKRSTRTAAGIWPAVLPEWSYIGKDEIVNVERGFKVDIPEQIKAGYTAFNGYVFTANDAALYNRQCEETERQIFLGGDNPSPMAKAAIEAARDQQNRLFKIIIGLPVEEC